MIDSKQPAITCTLRDYRALHHVTRQVLRMFPDEITASEKNIFGSTTIWVPVYPPPSHLTYSEIVAGAYFGFLAIPRTYKHFCDSAKRINRNRDALDAKDLHTDEQKRESEVARQFGLSDRREMQALYQSLRKLTNELCGFPTINALWQCNDHVKETVAIASDQERAVFANGPLFLWEYMQRSREMKMANITFGVHAGWVLYLHQHEDYVLAYAVNPATLRIGGFVDIPYTAEPHGLQDALRDLASRSYPDVSPGEVYFEEFPVFEPANPHSNQARQEG